MADQEPDVLPMSALTGGTAEPDTLPISALYGASHVSRETSRPVGGSSPMQGSIGGGDGGFAPFHPGGPGSPGVEPTTPEWMQHALTTPPRSKSKPRPVSMQETMASSPLLRSIAGSSKGKPQPEVYGPIPKGAVGYEIRKAQADQAHRQRAKVQADVDTLLHPQFNHQLPTESPYEQYTPDQKALYKKLGFPTEKVPTVRTIMQRHIEQLRQQQIEQEVHESGPSMTGSDEQVEALVNPPGARPVPVSGIGGERAAMQGFNPIHALERAIAAPILAIGDPAGSFRSGQDQMAMSQALGTALPAAAIQAAAANPVSFAQVLGDALFYNLQGGVPSDADSVLTNVGLMGFLHGLTHIAAGPIGSTESAQHAIDSMPIEPNAKAALKDAIRYLPKAQEEAVFPTVEPEAKKLSSNKGKSNELTEGTPPELSVDEKPVGSRRLKSKQSGAAIPDPLGIVPFAKEDIAGTAKDQVGKFKNLVKATKETFSPESVSEAAGKTARTIRATTGESAADMMHYMDQTSKLANEFGKLPEKERLAFSDAIARGQAQPNPKLQESADFLRTLLDQDRDRLLTEAKSFDPKLAARIQTEWDDNYFPRIYEFDPQLAGALDRNIKGGKTLTGRKTFLRKRTVADPEISRQVNEAAGRSLVTTNPFEMAQLYHAQMNKFIGGMKMMNEWKTTPMPDGSSNMVKFFRRKDLVPNGWTKIDDSIATVHGPRSEKGMRTIAGEYYAPDDVARVINNYLSPSFKGKPIYDAMNSANNAAIKVSLGLSAFHSTVTAMNMMTSDVALGLGEMTGRGVSLKTRLKGVADIATFFKSPITGLVKGEMAKRFLKQGYSIDALDFLKSGGFKYELDSHYDTKVSGDMKNAFRSGKTLSGIVRLPFAGAEQIANITMKGIVPRIKLAAGMDLARLELEKLEKRGVQIGSDEYRKAAASVVDTIDNRFGQLSRDNLFMDNRIKDSAQLATMFGWNLGSLREPLGAAKDIMTTRSRMKGGDDIFTKRMLFTASVPLTYAVVSGIYQYLHTGEGPKDLEDILHPRTGRMVPARFAADVKHKDGSVTKGKELEPAYPERVDLPGYMHDYVNWITNAPSTALSKRSPGIYDIETLGRALFNSDWKGDPLVYHKQDTLDKMKTIGKYLIGQLLPISVRNTARADGVVQKVEAFFGVKIHPRELSTAEQLRIQALHQLEISKKIAQDQDDYKPPPKKAKPVKLLGSNSRPRYRWEGGQMVANA